MSYENHLVSKKEAQKRVTESRLRAQLAFEAMSDVKNQVESDAAKRAYQRASDDLGDALFELSKWQVIEDREDE